MCWLPSFFLYQPENLVVSLSSRRDLPSDAHGCWPEGAGKGVEWPVGSLNNEASHGLCLSKVELHGFASNGVFLQPPDIAYPSPNGGKRKTPE